MMFSNARSSALAIAEVIVELRSELSEAFCLELPPSYAGFETQRGEADCEMRFRSLRSLEPSPGSLISSGSHWKLLQNESRHCFEFFHPLWNRLLVTATASCESLQYEVVFDETHCRRLWGASPSSKESRCPVYIMHPLDQLIFLRALALRDGFLVHACGAVIDGKAFVFAGHSGAGKTTLARMLAAEGVELLSDERIAIREVGDTFTAYGTPWAGEGNVTSADGYPLAGMFLLRRGPVHRVREGRPAKLTAEFLSCCLVPYYFPRETARILALVSDVASEVPLHKFEFSLQPGLLPVLAQRASAA